MELKQFSCVLGLAIGIITSYIPKASALTWTSGINTATTNYTEFPGQSFTPNLQGNAGSGTSLSSGSAFLNSFSFGSNSTGILYIFSSPYTGTPQSITSYTGVNKLGVSSAAVNGTYSFNGGLLLPDVTSKYYAYSDTSYTIQYSSGNPYNGGQETYATSSNSTYSTANDSLNFSANFSSPSASVPFEFSPTEGIALGLPLFIGLRMLKKRRALKNSSREVHDLTSAR